MPLSPVEERDSRCTKLLFQSIPIVKSGLPAFFIASAAGVPSVELSPSVIKTLREINSYNTVVECCEMVTEFARNEKCIMYSFQNCKFVEKTQKTLPNNTHHHVLCAHYLCYNR